MKLMHLKSGTDVRGTAVSTKEHPEYELTDEVISHITASFIRFLCKKTGKSADNLTVSVGHDSRISAIRIKNSVISVLSGMGAHILYCSYCSTPAMFMTTVTRNCDGAVQITASHHPYDRNGLKFFTRDGGLSGEELKEILIDAEKSPYINENKNGSIEEIDYISEYSAILREMIKKGVNADDYEHPLKDFKIAVDAGNGVGGFYAEKVLAVLGADTSASQFLDIDGMFPNHIPNPENKTAMEFIRKATVENKCDLGVIFDTDVDRASCVDETGEEINRNSIVALASVIALEGNFGGTVVTDSVTGDGLHSFIEDTLGGKHVRFKRGYKNVIDEAVRRTAAGENVPLAIETSGHAAFKENYYLDDGAYLVTKIIIKAAVLARDGRKIGDCIKSLKKPKEEKELRFNIKTADFKSTGEAIIEKIKVIAVNSSEMRLAPDNYEGVRVSFDDGKRCGWFLLRLSVHDPVMPFNAESDTDGGCREICKTFYNMIKDEEGLDLTPLKDFINLP
ncbi:MAG: phosphomannomutase/phosphoglucomutase [Oscillospiraceae bacterium]|nr:phosphomannomutase/phosphoglucomutase [Oscillospiraceae bacterium]